MNSQLIMQLHYKTRGTQQVSLIQEPREERSTENTSAVTRALLSTPENLSKEMDFILPPTMPAGGIPWEKVLPPLIPRLNGTYGQYNWSPKLIIPETDNASSAEVTCDDSGFTVQVDVKHFNPEDLIVKVIGDFVEVQGKHEERKDGPGFTTRQFNRRYRIPKGVDTMALESAVSPDGILIISAPMLHTQSYTPLT
ncbi:heat shock protein beta-6 isoform X2 [Maylandia zebra]|uniref:heat shock protein beta-6 isoform X2 n=1 Tax=Maylandia zebra TaxID=106582 RepID=UPI00032A0438|nr:heat shock protein beta-6 isoform X2 [Maylandia zebra]XP_026040154.1 heat shock protein beta-6 isoform X2 [Astatotilapia calliptera]